MLDGQSSAHTVATHAERISSFGVTTSTPIALLAVSVTTRATKNSLNVRFMKNLLLLFM